jgi:probable rRNA maturation factor
MPVAFACRAPAGAVWNRYLATRARQVLRALGIRRSELSLSLVADPEIHLLNRDYRGKDRPTDVLAFPLHEPPVPTDAASLGDVVISLDTAALAARERRRPLAAVLDELLVHGVLHLLGYDHEISPAEDRRMARKAKAVRTAIGSLALPAPAAAAARKAAAGAAAKAAPSSSPAKATRVRRRRPGRARRA